MTRFHAPLKALEPVDASGEARASRVKARIDATRRRQATRSRGWVFAAAATVMAAALGAGVSVLGRETRAGNAAAGSNARSAPSGDANGSDDAPMRAAGRTSILALASGAPLATHYRADEPIRLALSDGSVLDLARGAEVVFVVNTGATSPADRARVDLVQRRGRVSYDVEQTGRAWTIDARLASVEVIGTTFTVERDDDRVAVDVSDGTVLVRSDRLPDRLARVTQGERVIVRVEGDGDRPARLEAQPDDEQSSDRARDDRAVTDERIEALAPETAATRSATTATLLARADDARRRGDYERAAALLDEVASRRGAHGALASFTLARLQRDRLHAPMAAAAAFARAIELGLEEPLREAAFRARTECLRDAHRPDDATHAEQLWREAYPSSAAIPRESRGGAQ